jgi:transcriptional regulator with XRE-family HTH domain
MMRGLAASAVVTGTIGLGKRLRGAREAKGLSQAKLAEKLGVAQSVVSNYEIGKRRLDIVEFIVLTKLLHLKPASILAEIERAL